MQLTLRRAASQAFVVASLRVGAYDLEFMAPPSPMMLGRYALFEEIARGGMAAVHFGRLMGPVGFSRTVAIKRMHPHCASDPEFVVMFLEEARLAARIRHPNVVPTLDVVALDSEIFLVMDFVQGATLALLARQAHLAGETVPLPILSNIVVGTLLGLHAAHEITDERGEALHLVHRDVSPQNIMVGTDGVPRVLDFGVAKALGNVSHTRDGTLKGKLRYMSPEQVSGTDVTRQSDIWAVGVVLWETLTQRKMFTSASDAEALMRVMNDPIPLPTRDRGEAIPEALVQCVMKSLSRDRSVRYPTALAMATALREAVRPADQWDVGAWVTRIAGDSVDNRANRLREIESISSTNLIVDSSSDGGISSGRLSMPQSITSGSGIVVAPLPAPDATSSVSGAHLSVATVAVDRQPTPAPRAKGVLVAGAVAFIGLAALAGLFTMRSTAHDVTAASAIAANTAPPAAIPAPTASPDVSAAASAVAPGAVALPAPSASVAAVPEPSQPSTPASPTTTATAPARGAGAGAKSRGGSAKPGAAAGDLYGQH